MREIEFRGKLIKSNKWAYGNLDIKKTGTTIITPDDTPIGTYGRVIPATIGQYTGLKDKNEKKIFEGDIVKVYTKGKWRTGKVIYEHSEFIIDVTNNEDLEFGRTGIIERFVEVIGNIHDNPELLKEEL